MKKFPLKLSVILVIAFLGCNTNSNRMTNSSNMDSIKSAQNDVGITNINLMEIDFSGVEPFWDLKFEEDFAIYNAPDESNIKIFYKKKIDDINNCKLSDALIKISDKEFKIFGSMNNSSVEITIKVEQCDNGMSDENFTHKIILLRNKNDKYEGCGKIQ